jgi:DNA-binding beta-propeller fold protein YncE
LRTLAVLVVAAVLSGAAAKPRLIGAFDVVVEPSGTLLVADMSNRVYRARGRRLTVVAGTGRFGRSGDGRPAIRANVGFPVEVAVDPRGGFGIVSEEAHIRLVNARGRISTLARGLAQPTALSFDAAGNVYFSELGGRVGKIDRATRTVTTIADGLSRPHGQVVVGNTLYVCDTFANRLVAIDLSTLAVTTIAEGFNQPNDVALAPDGSLVVSDWGNDRVARVRGGTVTTVAALNRPNSVAVAPSGTIYATEQVFPRIRAIDPATGSVRTAVGGP